MTSLSYGRWLYTCIFSQSDSMFLDYWHGHIVFYSVRQQYRNATDMKNRACIANMITHTHKVGKRPVKYPRTLSSRREIINVVLIFTNYSSLPVGSFLISSLIPPKHSSAPFAPLRQGRTALASSPYNHSSTCRVSQVLALQH